MVAVLIRPDVLAARRASAAWGSAGRIGELLEQARHEPLRPPALTADLAAELVAAIDADRSA